MKAQSGKKNSSALSLTFALDGGGWSTLRPVRFTLEQETRCAFYRGWLGPSAGLNWCGISPPPPRPQGFDPRTVRRVAFRMSFRVNNQIFVL
jgi:hypothetical protein